MQTVPELKALNESLLQEQVELRKDLEEQKKIFEALFEENIRLKNLESSLAFDKVGEPTVNSAAHREAESEEPQQPQDVKESSTAADHPQQVLPCTNPPNSAPQRALFDLNCPPDDGFL
ncbi:hypothetical protein Taro_045272 [Colocasia esculenta]|uniref:Uncharacterized protein n=1 Tax=Colocasia esculenta TaxID=4460 RepID=A0A843X4I9_COLES|nr:hypothetical protein [Colocasia esculenta]